jgi:hypothetical protein
MMVKVSFKILPDCKLIIEKYAGPFSVELYEQMKLEEFSDPEFNSNYNVLADLRKASFGTQSLSSEKEMALVSKFLMSNKENVGKRKSAILTANPEQVVSSIFFMESVKPLPVIVESFSTVDAALKWLGVKDNKSCMDELL